jgi:hypothetical protein
MNLMGGDTSPSGSTGKLAPKGSRFRGGPANSHKEGRRPIYGRKSLAPSLKWEVSCFQRGLHIPLP